MWTTSSQTRIQMPLLRWYFATKEHNNHSCFKTTWLDSFAYWFRSCYYVAYHFKVIRYIIKLVVIN